MKTIVFIVSALLAVQLHFGLAAPKHEFFKNTVDTCKQKEGITDEATIETIKSKNLPENEDGKCLLACSLEEFGVIVNNAFSKDGALKTVERMFGQQPEKLEKMKSVIDACIPEVSGASNRCELAYMIAQCAKKHEAETF